MIAPLPVKPAPVMPEAEPERLAEAVRRALPELLKLDRYERRPPPHATDQSKQLKRYE